MQSRSSTLPLLAVAITLLLWSSAFVAIRHLGHTFSPGALSLGRLVVGSIALGAVLATRGWTRPTRKDWSGLVVIGVLWFGVYNVALNAGERRVDAGTAAMLIQLSPVLVAVLAAVFLRERATVWLGKPRGVPAVAQIFHRKGPRGRNSSSADGVRNRHGEQGDHRAMEVC